MKTEKTISRRQASIITSISFFLMIVIAPLADMAILEKVINPLDAQATFSAITQSTHLVRLAVLGLFIVIVLDIIISWSLFIFLKPVNRDISFLCILFRLIYSAIFAVASARILDALKMIKSSFDSAILQKNILQNLLSFKDTWSFGLIFFGLHLLLLGFLLIRLKGKVISILGILIIIAGFGYAFDNIALILNPGYSFNFAVYTFIGELLLPFWLLIKGGKNDLEELS